MEIKNQIIELISIMGSPEAVAAELGVSTSTLRNWMNGKPSRLGASAIRLLCWNLERDDAARCPTLAGAHR